MQAFGSVASLEAAYYRETGKQLLLSEQNLLDCAWDYGNTACLGGCGHESALLRYIAAAWLLLTSTNLVVNPYAGVT